MSIYACISLQCVCGCKHVLVSIYTWVWVHIHLIRVLCPWVIMILSYLQWLDFVRYIHIQKTCQLISDSSRTKFSSLLYLSILFTLGGAQVYSFIWVLITYKSSALMNLSSVFKWACHKIRYFDWYVNCWFQGCEKCEDRMRYATISLLLQNNPTKPQRLKC